MKKHLLIAAALALTACGGGTTTLPATKTQPTSQTAPPNSSISIAEKTVYLTPGGTLVDASTSITRINAYDPITFSTSPLPTGITLDFQKNPVTGSGSVMFNIGAPTAALGTYTTTLKGVSGGLTASAKLTIIVSASPPNGGAAPLDPTYVSAAATSTSVIVDWAAMTSATGYKLDRKVTGGSYSELASLSATQTVYTDSAITPGTSYVYRVRTMMTQGTSTGRESPTVTFAGPPTTANQYPVTLPTSSDHAFQGTLTATTASGTGDLDCRDFTSQAEAQIYFDSNGGSSSNNVDALDWNHNGIPCEVNEEWAIRSQRWAVPTTPTPPVVTPTPPVITPSPVVTPPAGTGMCYVNGYTTKKGTYVSGYYRRC